YDGLAAARRIVFAHFDVRECRRLGIIAITVTRLGNAYSSSLYAHFGNPPGIARSSRRNPNVHSAELAPFRGSRKRQLAVPNPAILRNPYDQIDIRRTADKLGIN